MDKVSELLAEAKPLYYKRQNEKRIVLGGIMSFCLALGVWLCQPQSAHFDEEGFDTYFTALYMSDVVAADEDSGDDVIPVDAYGLYEV